MAEVEDRHWWFRARREIIRVLLEQARIPAPRDILEVGAGTGGNLALLGEFGAVSAMETNEYARATAEERSGVAVRKGSLPGDFPFADSQFDVIAMFDVLEHVEKDTDALRLLAGRLKTGGRIVLTVPAYQWLWSDHDVRLHHFRRYNRALLSRTVQEAGLTVVFMTHFNTVLFPLAVVARGAQALGLAKGDPGSEVPPAALNRLLYGAFHTEVWLLRHLSLPFGLSLAAVLKAG